MFLSCLFVLKLLCWGSLPRYPGVEARKYEVVETGMLQTARWKVINEVLAKKYLHTSNASMTLLWTFVVVLNLVDVPRSTLHAYLHKHVYHWSGASIWTWTQILSSTTMNVSWRVCRYHQHFDWAVSRYVVCLVDDVANRNIGFLHGLHVAC